MNQLRPTRSDQTQMPRIYRNTAYHARIVANVEFARFVIFLVPSDEATPIEVIEQESAHRVDEDKLGRSDVGMSYRRSSF